MNADCLEDLVGDAIILAAGTDRLARILQGDNDDDRDAELLRQVRADEAALEELARDRYVKRTISEAEHRAARPELEDRIRETRRELAGRVGRGSLQGLDRAEALQKAWATGDVAWRSTLARLLLEAVVVNRPPQRANVFQAERVDLRWHV